MLDNLPPYLTLDGTKSGNFAHNFASHSPAFLMTDLSAGHYIGKSIFIIKFIVLGCYAVSNSS